MVVKIAGINLSPVFHSLCGCERLSARSGADIQHYFAGLWVKKLNAKLRGSVLNMKQSVFVCSQSFDRACAEKHDRVLDKADFFSPYSLGFKLGDQIVRIGFQRIYPGTKPGSAAE